MKVDEDGNLEALLLRLRESGERRSRVSVACMLQATGERSFGPMILLLGLLVLSPLSGIPGLPTAVAVAVALITVQLLLGRRHFWLPRWFLRRKVPGKRFDQALGVLLRGARPIDRMVKPRLRWLTRGPAFYLCALLCLMIALSMPPLELIPFANSLAGAALSCLGLSLIARDGLLALFSLVCFGGALALVLRALLL